MRERKKVTDFATMDDTALIAWRTQARARLERLPPLSRAHVRLTVTYDASTAEIDERARTAWKRED